MALAPSDRTISQNEIANFLLAECRERGENLTNLKLQKLLYYADAWNLALYDRELFTEEFQAWVHGPVLVSQYHRFKQYKWQPITEDVAKPELPEALAKHLSEIVDVFGSENAVALELMTHRERPWIEARGDTPETEPSNVRISKVTTRDYYRTLQ
jgi:uncharacterized phage-associated protein